jgi:hypothetical protein
VAHHHKTDFTSYSSELTSTQQRTCLMESIQSGTSQPDSFTTLAMLRMRGRSASVNSVMAWPLRPARPVRPRVT